jgi:hypothetical protein
MQNNNLQMRKKQIYSLELAPGNESGNVSGNGLDQYFVNE